MKKNILFRASMVGSLMTEPKTKVDKDLGNLSETSKTFIIDKWLFDTFGFRESIKNEYMDKGVECEQDSMQLAQDVLGGNFRSRYNTQLQNEYITGCPDIVLNDCVEDIKTSWNLKTFYNAELSKIYYAQAQCYMWLTGKKKYKLIYALVPTPEKMIYNECKKLVYKYNENYDNQDYIDECKQIVRNNDLIKELPIEKRVKVFAFDYDPNYIETLKVKIERAREYYKTLKL